MARRTKSTENCTCGAFDGCEHYNDCPDFAPNLTVEEIVALRTFLVEFGPRPELEGAVCTCEHGYGMHNTKFGLGRCRLCETCCGFWQSRGG